MEVHKSTHSSSTSLKRMPKNLDKAKNGLPEMFRFSKNTSQQDTGEFYLSFIEKRTRNSIFRGVKLVHEKGKWDFHRKSKNTMMNKGVRQRHIVK